MIRPDDDGGDVEWCAGDPAAAAPDDVAIGIGRYGVVDRDAGAIAHRPAGDEVGRGP